MKLKFLLLLTLLCMIANAQEKNEIKQEAKAVIADKFPTARFLNIQYQQYLPTDFDSELQSQDFQNGEIKNHSRLNVITNIPLISKQRWSITSTFQYRYENLEINNFEAIAPELPQVKNNYDFHYLSAALSFTYFSTLFKKPFIYNASIFADGTQKDAERIKGFVGATMILKRTERTMIGVGLLVFIDPASPFPLAPVFTMEHKFKNSPWIFDLILPQRILFKRPVYENGRFSIGSELSSDGFYVYSNRPGFADVYDYRQLEIKSGITYEHYINKNIITTFKAGLANVFNSRLSERGESTNDYIFASNQNATGYFSLGISFNPNMKKKK